MVFRKKNEKQNTKLVLQFQRWWVPNIMTKAALLLAPCWSYRLDAWPQQFSFTCQGHRIHEGVREGLLIATRLLTSENLTVIGFSSSIWTGYSHLIKVWQSGTPGLSRHKGPKPLRLIKNKAQNNSFESSARLSVCNKSMGTLSSGLNQLRP